MTKSANPSQQTYRESGLVQSPSPDVTPHCGVAL